MFATVVGNGITVLGVGPLHALVDGVAGVSIGIGVNVGVTVN